MPARFRSELIAAIATALALGGCGVDVPDIPDLAGSAPHDRMTVIFNGQRTTIAQSGSISVQIGGVPELSYDGPLGCKGGYFTDSESDLYFRYDAKRAFLLRYDTLYRFDGPPARAGGQLVWNRSFDGDRITVLANCPAPR